MNEETIKLGSSRRIIYTDLHRNAKFHGILHKCQSQTAPSSFCRNSLFSWHCSDNTKL